MQTRSVGRSGLQVSVVGLGCNNLGGRIDLAASRRVVGQALESGITLFDVADVYGRDLHVGASETALGDALGARRKEIVLATKFGLPMDETGRRQGGSRRYIVQAVEESLARLGTDWIDLYQLHLPDPLTPIEETLRALDDLVRAGKVRYAGCSNLPAWQVADAWHTAQRLNLGGFVSCQDELSLVATQARRELLPAMRHFGLGLLPYFPLASGLLSGKYRRGAELPPDSRFGRFQRLATPYLTQANWDRVEALQALADRNGRALIDLAFGWLLAQQPVCSVIAGATRPEQVVRNVAAGGTLLSGTELDEIEALLQQPA